LLKFLGTEGSGGSLGDLRSIFMLGRGTLYNCCNRVVTAIRSLRDSVIQWPDDDERVIIANRIFREYHFRNCVGFIDGTLFPLAFQPRTEDSPDYSGRKYGYSISSLIVCDDQRLIQYYLAGWPGSAHDNRIFKQTGLYQSPEKFFSSIEYLLGDSAFENTWFMVSAYKKPANMTLPREQEVFNSALAKPRVISEQTIGILKGRFPWLRHIRMHITDDRKSLRRILRYVEVCIILHNLLIKQEDAGDDNWIDDDDFSAFDDAERAPNVVDELDQSIPPHAPSD